MTVRLVSMDASSVHGQAMATRPGKEGRWLAGPGRGRAWPFSQTPARPSFFERRSHDSEFCVVSVGRRRREFEATSSDVADGGVAAASKGAMYQAMHCCREKQGIQQTAIRRRRIRCFLHSPSDANCIFGRPGGLTGLTGPQPYVSPSLRAFQIAVLLQIAQSQFVSVESHSSVFFRLLYVVNMVSKTCFLINVVK